MKLLSFVAVFARVASSAMIHPGHQGSDLKTRNEIQNDAATAWAAPGFAVHGREALVTGDGHASVIKHSPVFKRQPWFSEKWTPGFYQDQDDEEPEAPEEPKEPSVELSTWPPTPPRGVDKKKLRVWVRINTYMYRPQDLKNSQKLKHEGLQDLTTEIGGKHTDVVIGRSRNYYMFGLVLKGDAWRHVNNGDGAITEIEAEPMDLHSHSKWIFKGVIQSAEIKSPSSPILEDIGKFLFYTEFL
ncbi:hypothetical protein PspLS_03051 [Pyricularia sp. CBS 133598]|nr:hypothetical protein PspLS_03051 [Pyricularia sp. CBS 133598]